MTHRSTGFTTMIKHQILTLPGLNQQIEQPNQTQTKTQISLQRKGKQLIKISISTTDRQKRIILSKTQISIKEKEKVVLKIKMMKPSTLKEMRKGFRTHTMKMGFQNLQARMQKKRMTLWKISERSSGLILVQK